MLVDFTADWCAICKQNEFVALNRQETIDYVESNGIVPLMADFTNEDPQIAKWLERFEQNGVPLTVIFPADPNADPTIIRGAYSKSHLLKELRKANGKKANGKKADEKIADGIEADGF